MKTRLLRHSIPKYGCLALLFFCLVVSCAEDQPSAIKAVQKQFVYPVLKSKPFNHVLRLELQNKDTLNPEFLTEVTINFGEQTVLKDIEEVAVYAVGNEEKFIEENSSQFAVTKDIKYSIKLKGSSKLSHSVNYYWVSVKLKNKADIDNKISVTSESVTIGDQTIAMDPIPEHEDKLLRIGVAVRKHQDDSVHTYRIPGLVRANDGTLISCYDVRRDNGRDLQGNIDIGISRSLDGGNTWEPMQIAMDKGAFGGLPEKYNGISDAALLVDRKTGDIYLAALWMYGLINKEGQWVEGLTEDSKQWNHQWRNKGSQPGFGLKQTSQFLISKSTDNGKTWGEPINITKMCKEEQWWLFAPAPGNGITMKDGTLVFPTQGRDENGKPFSNITYSKDGGKTWVSSNPAHNNTTECAVVELDSGVLMLNMRDNRNKKDKSDTNGRAIYTTADLGKTWKEHPTSHSALIEPVCMASLFKYESKNSSPILFFSNPNTKDGRYNLTLKASYDLGETWHEENQLLFDQGRGRGYSSITKVDDSSIGILYEGSQADMTFLKIPLSEMRTGN